MKSCMNKMIKKLIEHVNINYETVEKITFQLFFDGSICNCASNVRDLFKFSNQYIRNKLHRHTRISLSMMQFVFNYL